MNKKPSINTRCVANNYAMPGERIAEVSSNGKGCLIAVRNQSDGGLLVSVYRKDAGVTVADEGSDIADLHQRNVRLLDALETLRSCPECNLDECDRETVKALDLADEVIEEVKSARPIPGSNADLRDVLRKLLPLAADVPVRLLEQAREYPKGSLDREELNEASASAAAAIQRAEALLGVK